MTSPHHNVFFYYRGPTPARAGRRASATTQQVEDNSTKALVNVLELSGADVVASFLRRFAPVLAEAWPGASPSSSYNVGRRARRRRAAGFLGLSLLGQVKGPFIAASEGSRIDAAILVPGAGLLAVEVKAVDDLDGPQLARHEDGRHRQRAYRDALADLLPAVHGWLPTLRIADFEVVEWIYGRGARRRMEQLLAERLVAEPNR